MNGSNVALMCVPGCTMTGTKEANARLVAAAPELLAACRQSLITLDPMDNDHAELWRLLRSAIARATGETLG